MTDFSDYIVYADESGDHGLVRIDPEYPVFALTFCIFRKEDYVNIVAPALQRFKFEFWGHDAVVLHEHEIRKEKGDFAFLMTDRKLRQKFMEKLTRIMEDAPITIIASVIDKAPLKKQYANPWNPYVIALHFCLERLFDFLNLNDQEGKLTHVIFESRGVNEDRLLELEFRRLCDENQQWGWQRKDFSKMKFEPRFVKKAINSTGLQLADLTARPIALNVLRPGQSNRAYEVITPKLTARKVFP